MSQDLDQYNIRRYFPQVNDTDSDEGGIVKDYLLADSNSKQTEKIKGGGNEVMKNLFVYNLLQHPQTKMADPRPRIINVKNLYEDFNTINSLNVLDSNGDGDGDGEAGEISYLIRREMKGGGQIRPEKINSLDKQETLGLLVKKNNVILVTGGQNLNIGSEIKRQLVRNHKLISGVSGKGKVILLNHKNIHSFLDRILNDDNNSSKGNGDGDGKLEDIVILDHFQNRTLETDMTLYLLRNLMITGKWNGKLVIVSFSLKNKNLIEYFSTVTGLKMGALQLPLKEEVMVFDDFQITSWDINSDIAREKFWDLLYGRIYLAIQKILNDRAVGGKGNILVYLPTDYSIHKCQKFLQKSLGDTMNKLGVYAFGEGKGQNKGIYLIKDIAEVHWIDEVDYVIDSGLLMIKDFDANKRIYICKLDHITDLQANERMMPANKAVFRLYTINFLLDHLEPEVRRSPNIGKWIIKLMSWGGESFDFQIVKQIFTKDLLSPLPLGRFLDFWEYMVDIKLVGDRLDSEGKLKFLARDCFRPLDLSLELCSVLLMGRNLIKNQQLLADTVAILNHGGSISGQWIFESEERNKYSNNAGDVFGLVKWLRNGEIDRKKHKIIKMSNEITIKLSGLDKKCLIVPKTKLKNLSDIAIIINILKEIYNRNIVNYKNGKAILELRNDSEKYDSEKYDSDHDNDHNSEMVKFKPGLLKIDQQSSTQLLPLELKKRGDFLNDEEFLFGDQLINLEYGWNN